MNRLYGPLRRLGSLPAISTVLARYGALEIRDRTALLMLGVFMAALLFYAAVWSPLASYAAAAADRYSGQLVLWQYLQSTEAEARSVSGRQPQTDRSGQSLLTLVSRTSQTVGVKPSRLQPEGSEEVSVWFEAVEFNQLLLWLDQLRSQSLVVRQLSIDRQETPGRVNARIVLLG